MSRNKRRIDMNKYLHGNNKYRKTRSNKSNKQNHSNYLPRISKSARQRSRIQRIDLHSLGIHQARERIKQECRYSDKDVTIKFIHGFNNGTAIKDFIRNGQLRQSLDSTGISGEIWWDASGVTFFNKN